MEKENAYITLLTTDNYIYYVLALAESLKLTHPKYKLYCCVTPNISIKTRSILTCLDVAVVEIPTTNIRSLAEKMAEKNMVTKYVNALYKLEILNLTQFKKCVYLDSDLMIKKNIDELFDKPDWTASEDCLPVKTVPDSYKLGCSFFNAGLFTFTPNPELYNRIISELPSLPKNIKWHDQAILAYYNQDWMDRKELHLPVGYHLILGQRENIAQIYIDSGHSIDDVHVFHYVTYKNAPYKTVQNLKSNVFSYYYEYYVFINSIIDKYKIALEKNNLKNIHKELMIDLVVPYVDCSDKNWQEEFTKYNDSSVKSKGINAENRFRGQGEFFRYFFRSIEKYMPFINKLYLLVSNKSQVPAWLDTKVVNIIEHKEFIPKELLPTFNSGTIEMFIQNIKGLSEYFLYANDDFYAVNSIKKEDFFTENACRFNFLNEQKQPTNDLWQCMCQNNNSIIYDQTNILPYKRLDHEFRPYLRSKCVDCYNKHKNEILASITRFRQRKNLTCFLFSIYLDKIGLRKSSVLRLGYIYSMMNDATINYRLGHSDTICLNDTSTESNIYANDTIVAFFGSNFESKSKYELTDMPQNYKTIIKQAIITSGYKKRPTRTAYLYF